MNKKIKFRFGAAFSGALVGAGVAGGLYFFDLLSWTVPVLWAPEILAGFAAIVSLFSVAIYISRHRPEIVVAIVIGMFAASVSVTVVTLLPAVLGERPAWAPIYESALYDLEVDRTLIPADLVAAVQNPLSGERSTLHYVGAREDGSFLMLSSAGTEIFDLAQSLEQPRAVISFWPSMAGPSAVVDLTEIEGQVAFGRGLLFDEKRQEVLISTIPRSTECVGLELWRIPVEFDPFVVGSPEQIFRSEPCLSGSAGYQQFGGRIAQGAFGEIYLSVGDFANGVSTTREELADGPYSTRPGVLQDPATYGVVVRIETDGSSEVISRGHRNPQGLSWDPETSTLWLSEHGPKGGDELNRIVPGRDYGWPDVTYGGPYGGQPQPDESWDFGRWFGKSHGEFEEPVLTWLPAIAASQLVVYQGEMFPEWQGDVVLGSFKGTLHRVRITEDRVLFDESIDIGTRPRDLVELPDGSLMITTDYDEIMRISAKSLQSE